MTSLEYICMQKCSVDQSCLTPWTVVCQAPLSMEFSRQEYWSRLPFPAPEFLPSPGMEHAFLVSPALVEGSSTIVQLESLDNIDVNISW